MKLFRRIYLQVFIGCLLLSQVSFLYCLYESQRQSLADTQQYAGESLSGTLSAFRDRFSTYEAALSGKEQKQLDLAAINAFRNVFASDGALYRDGEELFNVCPYEFDCDAVSEPGRYKYIQYGSILVLGTQAVGESRLQVFCGEIQLYEAEYLVFTYKDVTDIYRHTRILFVRGLAVSLTLLAVIGSVLYCGIYRAIRPLWELRQAAASIEGGDYGTQVPVRTKDEIGELTVSFNRMVQKINEHIEKLNQANAAQRRLTGSLAHELKTPVTALVGYSDLLLTVQLTEEQRVRALEYIRSESRRLSRLSAKMMELSGLYQLDESVSLKETGVRRLLEKLRSLTRYRLDEKQLQMEISCSPEGLTAWMDEDLMISLLMNLVDNACKASPEGSTITVSASGRGICVADSGKGIPKAEVARVTEAFYMVDKSRSKSSGGLGLGLAVCDQIAQLHHAQLHIESEEGKGTSVSVLWLETPPPGVGGRSHCSIENASRWSSALETPPPGVGGRSHCSIENTSRWSSAVDGKKHRKNTK